MGADGAILLELAADPAVVTVDVDPGAVAEIRARNPSLANRRYAVVPRA